MKINWNYVPKYSFYCKDLKTPYDVSLFMKKYKIRKYLYKIMFKGVLLKFGMSGDNSRTYGERLYRQLGHCKSWGSQRLKGSSGADWLIIEEDFKNLYGIDIDHNHINVTVYDFTNYPYESLDHWGELNFAENCLIEEYVRVVGEKPIGNINDEANIKRRPMVSAKVWSDMFS